MTKLLIKKCISLLVIAVAVLFSIQTVMDAEPAAAANISIIIDGQTVPSDVSPTIINDRTMVPVRVIGEYLNATVVWDNSTRTATITKGSTTLKLTEGQYSYTLNGTSNSLDVPITIIGDRTMAPLRVISEALGAGVLWTNNTVYVSSSGTVLIQVNQVDGNVVNLRQGTSTDYPVVGTVTSGTYLEIIGVASNGWYQIKTANGEDAYITNEYTSLYSGNNAGSPVTPTPDPGTSEEQPSSGDTNGTLSVVNRTSGTGQSSIAFNIGSGTASVVSNNGNQVVLQIDGAHIDTGTWMPAENLLPFNGFKVENYGSNAVRMTANVTNEGYFRLDINGSTFTVTAVAKHKNGTLGLSGKTIVVSAGHGVYSTGGAIDRGAVSTVDPSFDEVDFNTYVAQKLRDKLEAAGATVIMIREDENPINMTLYQRSVIANTANADAFIEIHGDSATSTATGIGTWIYTDSARLTSSAQVDMRNEFGSVMNAAMASATGQPAYVKYGNFSVLRETEIPCVLIECGFLSNPHDVALLKDPAYWEKLAQGMYNGLYNYFAY